MDVAVEESGRVARAPVEIERAAEQTRAAADQTKLAARAVADATTRLLSAALRVVRSRETAGLLEHAAPCPTRFGRWACTCGLVDLRDALEMLDDAVPR